MQIDEKTVLKIGSLSRIEIKEDEIANYKDSLSTILSWVEQLSEVDTEGVEPLTSVHIQQMPEREDIVKEGDQANCILRNAPEKELNMFAVPKVVE